MDMFRITDQRHTNAMIAAVEPRHADPPISSRPTSTAIPTRLWDAWNVDRMYAAGIPMRVTVHRGR